MDDARELPSKARPATGSFTASGFVGARLFRSEEPDRGGYPEQGTSQHHSEAQEPAASVGTSRSRRCGNRLIGRNAISHDACSASFVFKTNMRVIYPKIKMNAVPYTSSSSFSAFLTPEKDALDQKFPGRRSLPDLDFRARKSHGFG